MWPSPLLSYSKRSQTLSEKKRASQKKAAVLLSDALAFCSSPGMQDKLFINASIFQKASLYS